MKPTISIIAALSENRVIGKNNKLPWHIPEDLKRFKQLTFGHPVIMGRKTFESIGKPLPGRKNIIVTHNNNYTAAGITVVHSLEEAIALSKDPSEIFIIGGAQIFDQALTFADKLYLTLVKGSFDGDAYFPDYSLFNKVVSKKDSQEENLKYTFIDLVRVSSV